MRAEFEVTIATPLSAGWYDPALVDRNFYIRPTEIKGVWRWWARAFAAGALYEAGCTGPDFLRRVHEIVAERLGLGSTKAASRYDLTVEVLERPRVVDSSRENLQRFRLLNLGRRKGRPAVEYAIGGRFKIILEGDADIQLVASILAVALTLSGIGKGGRKALGSLDIIRVSGAAPRRPLNEIINEIRRQISVQRCGPPRELPKISAVSNEVFEVYKVNVDFHHLHNMFLRSERARMAKLYYAAPDPLNQKAWFLGLPREQKGTGYHINDIEVKRRASPIFVAWHSIQHVFGGGGYISIFLSQDWPTQLTWVGESGRKLIQINEQTLRDAKSAFLALLNQFGWKPQRVWP
ncbi:type III-B CRISPR module RAMP protein Cmr1 [Pyrobaculum calidifontis]|uniref:CRISPR-associated protein, Cmr1 family n=1 Tax=Pyrobaculum calidifontis (strain DSM 21063 / JCM 11548 / VA1) TaxID=410359 RepID=A3MVP3_PYRCJ|nr:type III-B CRISPR module RAMP protein Cmr1 [Pyrobaculum calidifontis]ABO08710.1 CRISPR-associated protein, Cmr1 family [Pyrobaculum calidifontis JCM 11548]